MYSVILHEQSIPLQGAGIPEWLIHEDWALLQVFYQDHCLNNFTFSLLVIAVIRQGWNPPE